LSAQEQQELQKLAERKQVKEFMTMYTNLTERCFNDCITDFTSKSLGSKEETCLNRCAAKFLNSTDRVGVRFAE
ncbi:hypothetical protein L211DRAFT_759522, partial [Terfezia boudieri ATCC MYA-4762]